MAASEAVSYRRDGNVGIVRFERPDNRNSMTPEVLDAFMACSLKAQADRDLRAVVITGSGSCFSAGADFRASVQREGDARLPHERSFAMYQPFLSILDIEVPVIGALNGHAVGGGFGLALACDIRIGNVASKYGANFCKLGLAPGMGISFTLPALVGSALAAEMLYTGRLLLGDEAAAAGILTSALPGDQVVARAMDLAAEIAGCAPLAVRATKRALRSDLPARIREAARQESYAQAATIETDDFSEGVAALLGKRDPVFSGR